MRKIMVHYLLVILTYLVVLLPDPHNNGYASGYNGFVDGANDGFKKNSVNVATCADSNLIGSSGSYW